VHQQFLLFFTNIPGQQKRPGNADLFSSAARMAPAVNPDAL
jgi:hypothetical protein